MDEVIGLERLSDGHIDHTTSGINSKDISDAVCGSIFEASKHAEEFAYDYGESLDMIMNANIETSFSKEVVEDFEKEMLSILDPVREVREQASNA